MRKKTKEKINNLEASNKYLKITVIILSILVVIGLGLLATKSIIKKKVVYSDMDYLIVNKEGVLTGFTEYNLTKKLKVEYDKEGLRTSKTYSPGDKLTTLIKHEEKKKVVIPSNVKKVDKDVFFGSSDIKELKVEMKINKIEDNMFSSSTITKITLPASVKTIGVNAFSGSVYLKEVNFEKGSKLTEVQAGAFQGCSSLKSFNLKKVKKIGKQAFYGCNSIKKLYLSNDLKEVGDEAFKYLANNSKLILESIKVRPLVTGKYTLNKTSIKLDHKAFK